MEIALYVIAAIVTLGLALSIAVLWSLNSYFGHLDLNLSAGGYALDEKTLPPKPDEVLELDQKC